MKIREMTIRDFLKQRIQIMRVSAAMVLFLLFWIIGLPTNLAVAVSLCLFLLAIASVAVPLSFIGRTPCD